MKHKTPKIILASLLSVSMIALQGCVLDDDNSTDIAAAAFPDPVSCFAEAKRQRDAYNDGTSTDGITITESMCRQAFAATSAAYEETAPRYDAKAVCEEESGGTGSCKQEVRPDGTSVWMPLLAGFMVGRLLTPAPVSGGPVLPPVQNQITGPVVPPTPGMKSCDPKKDKDCGSGSNFVFSPIYKSNDGGYRTASGVALQSNRLPAISMKPTTFIKPASTVRAKPIHIAPSKITVPKLAPMTRTTVRSTGGFGGARISVRVGGFS